MRANVIAGIGAAVSLIVLTTGCTSHRCSLWVDVYSGEPVTMTSLIDELAEARVIYLGERHTVDRHHDVQAAIVAALVERDVRLVLALEQLEDFHQPVVDRYNAGEIDFETLAAEIEWEQRWSNYADYRPVIEAARAAGAPLLALNAKRETVRAVARQGVSGLAPEVRAELPDEIDLDDPVYAAHLRQVMMVHAGMPEQMMRMMFEAQVVRDETMAARLCSFLQSDAGRGRTAVVLCGSGHVSWGLGIPARVRRRMPDVRDRIIVMSESGDVELSPQMRAMAREVEITHEDLRMIPSPIADYLHVTAARAGAD